MWLVTHSDLNGWGDAFQIQVGNFSRKWRTLPENFKFNRIETGVPAAVWLRTMDDFAAFDSVWDAWVVQGSTPTRCCGKVEMNNPNCRVEILVTAAL